MDRMNIAVLVVYSCILLIFPTWADAATKTWTGTTDGTWNTNANWGGTKPVAGDDLVFPSGASNLSTNNNIAANTSFNSITFTGTGYTLAGNAIHLPAGGITSNVSGGSNTISLNTVLTANSTVAVTNANETLSMSGIISAAFSLTKTGAGTLHLSGVNTFSGGLIIKNGTVEGDSSVKTFGGAAGTVTLGDSGGGVNPATIMGNDSSVFANPIVLASTTTGTLTVEDNSSNATFSGGVTGTNNLTVYEADSSGATTLTFSTGSINNTGTVTATSPGTGPQTGQVNIKSVIGTNVTGVINNSTGNLNLYGNNTWTGGLTVKQGYVSGQNNAHCFGSITGGGSHGTITLGDSSGSNSAALINNDTLTYANPIVLSSGTSGTLSILNGANYGIFSGGITGSNNINFAVVPGGAGDITISTGSLNNTGTVSNITSSYGGDNLVVNSVIGSNVTDLVINNTVAGGVYSSGGGVQLTNGSNAFTGNIIVKSGFIYLTNGTAASSGNIILGDSSGGTNNATLACNFNTTLSNPIQLASSTTGTLEIYVDNSRPTLSGGITGSNNITVFDDASGAYATTFSTGSINNTGTFSHLGDGVAATTVNSVIGSNVTSIVQNSTTSSLTLAGNNSNTGNLTITSGTLALSGTTNLNVSGNWSDAATFTPNSSTVTFNGTSGQTVTSGGQSFNNVTVTNGSSGGVTFTDAMTTANFKDTTQGSNLYFQNGTNYTISGTLTLGGTACGLISLDTDDGLASNFKITPSGGTQSVSYLTVDRADVGTHNITCTSCTNGGHNNGGSGNATLVFSGSPGSCTPSTTNGVFYGMDF